MYGALTRKASLTRYSGLLLVHIRYQQYHNLCIWGCKQPSRSPVQGPVIIIGPPKCYTTPRSPRHGSPPNTASFALPSYRPITDFFEAKRQSADLFTGAVCEAGWSIHNVKVVAALARSSILDLCASPAVSFRASLWLTACMVATDPAVYQGEDSKDLGIPAALLRSMRMAKLLLGARDDNIAAQFPAAYEWIDHLLK